MHWKKKLYLTKKGLNALLLIYKINYGLEQCFLGK